eukprot:357826-Chlamydomonas_euryale.AAC.3
MSSCLCAPTAAAEAAGDHCELATHDESRPKLAPRAAPWRGVFVPPDCSVLYGTTHPAHRGMPKAHQQHVCGGVVVVGGGGRALRLWLVGS